MSNRLASEPSPYLRQHADNPVDWWPWGPAAFAEAQRLGKPVFLSIGYAACHWCHVMAHESFEDAATAALMNELYINIKVDREERPEVDTIYMNAIQVMGEGGGWPLSAFCLPDGRPYFLGTYFPITPRFGRASFQDVLRAMSAAFHTRRGDAEDNAAALVDGLARVDAHFRRGAGDAAAAGAARLDSSLLIAAGKQLAERCDPVRGGLRGEPKFPSSSSHELLARASRFPFGDAAKTAFLTWARGMADGGIYDHLGGGFARYSVDSKWLVPHFEKMLYDQAQLLVIYAYAAALGDDRAREVIVETVAFMDRELSDASGGLWSSLDADSEGEEGKFYVWTPGQVRDVVGAAAALVFNHAYGVTDAGNFEHQTSVLSRVTRRASEDEESHLAQLRAQLLAARANRVRPGTDDKVLTGWNGLAISGLVAAWRATGHAPALALAVRVATFLREVMIDGRSPAGIDGTAHTGGAEAILDRSRESGSGAGVGAAGGVASLAIARVFHSGKPMKLDGTLDDYAYCAEAFLVLAEATGDRSWWDLGVGLSHTIRARFVEERDGTIAFFLTPDGESLLIHRPESHHDSALPAGAAVATAVLVRLGLVSGDADALGLAERYLAQRLATVSGGNPAATSALLGALDLYLNAKISVITDGYGRDELLVAARRAFSPTWCLAGPWAHASILDGKRPNDGRAQAFVCTGPVCSPPIDDPGQLAQLLGST